MARSWASLPADILEEISGRLSTEADHLHVHRVCAHWRASTSLPSAGHRPWVVASRPYPWDRTAPAGRYSVWLLDGVQRVDAAFPAPPAGVQLPWCCGMPRGWLALSDHENAPTRVVLWDPSSGTDISLPPLRSVLQVFLSEDPLAAPPRHWMAFASQRRGCCVEQKMYFWRPGDDAWSLMMLGRYNSTVRVDSVAFHDGKMFFTDYNHVLVIYDIINAGTAAPPTFVRELNLQHAVNPLCRCPNFHIVRATHVVACDRDLLLVVLHGRDHPCFAEIYKPADWTATRLELGDRVTDLGGHALFLGRGDAFALRAEDFPWIRRNLRLLPATRDLESGVLKRYPCPQKHKEERRKWWPYSWFCLKRSFFFKE